MALSVDRGRVNGSLGCDSSDVAELIDKSAQGYRCQDCMDG